MNKYIVLYSIVLVNCLGCRLDRVMINGSKWTESKIYQQFLKLQAFDYELSYHNLSEISEELERIPSAYPNITKVFSLGKTAENRDIPAVIISKGLFGGKVVVFECGIHAREWISVAFCLWSINKLVTNDSLLDSYQFLIIPVLNPDGYVFSWETHRFWRKNREKFNGTECVGTDINRNWETKEFCTQTAVNNSCDQTYCGETPFSTAEAKALSDYLLANKKDLFVYFSFHSYRQLWIYPQSYQNESHPTAPLLENLAKIGVDALHRMYGTTYEYGHFTQLLYPASGVSIDWVYDTLNVKIAFAIELRDRGDYGFLLPCYFIKPVCEETWAGIEAVLNHLADNESFGTNYSPSGSQFANLQGSGHSLSPQSLIAIINSLLFLNYLFFLI